MAVPGNYSPCACLAHSTQRPTPCQDEAISRNGGGTFIDWTDMLSPLPHNSLRKPPYVCHLCPYFSYYKPYLNRHLRTHSSESPFVCQTCGHRFRHSYRLKTHMRIHTGERPYACKFCGKSYTRKESLDFHHSVAHVKADNFT
ncbi:Zinc finger protein 585A [Araneus ventricosus]|uniref:Zinc finger protein 585A n=1 Tax=Araneus ventricosus TaxID=182803 RepID=A0A4Y2KI21_ARAVE|nr:Zinc finger protein 585A [Araneus ventricosus]